jgi:hypothetical protein
MHAGSASLDATSWVSSFMTSDMTLQYANNPILRGPEVLAMFQSVFPQLDLMEHTVEYFDFVSPKIYQAASIRYRIKGDDASMEIVIPGFAVFWVREEEGRLMMYRAETFLDPSQVFARIAEKAAGGAT